MMHNLKEVIMSPTKFAVRCEEINRLLETARQAGDLIQMQLLLAEQTSLLRSMYGTQQFTRS